MTFLVAASWAICSVLRVPFQPNIPDWNEPRWSDGKI
jgi:hypothetical protein